MAYLQLEETERRIGIADHQKFNGLGLDRQYGSLAQVYDCHDATVVRGNVPDKRIILLDCPHVRSQCVILAVDGAL